MSFSQDVKKSLCDINNTGCCRLAECYGLLLFNRAFSYKEIVLLTENKATAERCVKIIKTTFSVTAKIEQNQALNGMYKVTVDNEIDRKKIMIGFGYNYNDIMKKINYDIVGRDCCAQSFLRGAFLACGGMSNPKKEYHLEFSVSDFMLADEFYSFLKKRGFMPRKSLREKNNLIYFKDSGTLEDILTAIGATGFSLEIMGIKIMKDMRNKANRLSNCDSANIAKTVEAAIAQRNAIELLDSKGRLDSLSENLKFVAKLRMDNPEASLSDLVRLCGGEISKSGLNHRLKKLVDLSKDL